MKNGSALLVSVRSAEEAELAIEGGADLIDVKEPARGSLGKADESVILEVIQRVNGRRQVSAAMGELLDTPHCHSKVLPALDYVKWGLSGCHPDYHWRHHINQLRLQLQERSLPTRLVMVAYADCDAAQAPPILDVVAFACETSHCALLIDTYRKSKGENLLTWLSLDEILQIRRQCLQKDVPLALAGSLGFAEIAYLKDVSPDWFAIRGAACREDRESMIDPERVRKIFELLASGDSTPTIHHHRQ